MTEDRLAATGLYILMTLAMLTLVWRSRSHALLETGAWVTAAFALDTAAFYALGPSLEPLVGPSIDALVIVMLGSVALRHHSWVTWSVIVILTVSIIVAISGIINQTQGSQLYYSALNVLFVARLVLLGGMAVHVMAIRTNPRLRRIAHSHLYRTSCKTGSSENGSR